MTHARIQKLMNGANSSARKHVLAANVGQALLQINQKPYFAVGAGGKARQAALGWKYADLAAIPNQESFAKTGTHRHQRSSRPRLQHSLVNHSQIRGWQLIEAPGGGDDIV